MIVFEFKEIKSEGMAIEKLEAAGLRTTNTTNEPYGANNFRVYNSDEFTGIWYPSLKVLNLFGKRRINGIKFYEKNYTQLIEAADSYKVMKTKRW